MTCGDDSWLGLVYLQLKAATSEFKPKHVKGSKDAPVVCAWVAQIMQCRLQDEQQIQLSTVSANKLRNV